MARSGILTLKWTFGYQHRWNHQDRRRFQQYFRLHLRHGTTADSPRCVDTVRTRKRSRSEHSGLMPAELLDSKHAMLRVLGNLTLMNAKLFKMLGKRVEGQQRRMG